VLRITHDGDHASAMDHRTRALLRAARVTLKLVDKHYSSTTFATRKLLSDAVANAEA
jgi:hypothetical protein